MQTRRKEKGHFLLVCTKKKEQLKKTSSGKKFHLRDEKVPTNKQAENSWTSERIVLGVHTPGTYTRELYVHHDTPQNLCMQPTRDRQRETRLSIHVTGNHQISFWKEYRECRAPLGSSTKQKRLLFLLFFFFYCLWLKFSQERKKEGDRWKREEPKRRKERMKETQKNEERRRG